MIDAVRLGDHARVVGDHQDGPFVAIAHQQFDHGATVAMVQGGSGLIGEDHVRLVDHGAGNDEALPFAAGHAARPWIGAWAARNRAVLSITDRSSILLVVYTAFSGAVVRGLWQQIPPPLFATLLLVVGFLLGVALLITLLAGRAMGFSRVDEVALIFCGAQKSLVSGVPIANALVSGAAIGPILLPIMLYHPMQLLICAWIARRYAAGEEMRNSSILDPAPALARRQASRRR